MVQVNEASSSSSDFVRLYTRGTFVSYKRRLKTLHHKTALLKIDGVKSSEDVDFYLGKRVAYIYKAARPQKRAGGETSRFRVIWGKVQRAHGSNGVVRAAFRTNLPPQALGKTVRVFMYPSRI